MLRDSIFLGFLAKVLQYFFRLNMHVICHSYLILFDLVTLILFGEEYKL